MIPSFKRLLGSALAGTLLASSLGLAASASPVQVAQANTCGVTLRGTITQVFRPGEFAMHVDNQHVGSIHVYDAGARIDARGSRLAAGTYAGVLGCFTNGMRTFRASRVTLAPSESSYLSWVNRSSDTDDQGAGTGPCHVSLFGNVTQVWNNGVEFTLQTTGDIGSIHVYDNGARINHNGLPIRDGAYTGVYGCFIKNQQAFHADEVTLAASSGAYGQSYHPAVALTGYVDEVGRGWIGVRTRYYGHVHVITNRRNIRAGENVSIHGTYNPRLRQINANAIAVI